MSQMNWLKLMMIISFLYEWRQSISSLRMNGSSGQLFQISKIRLSTILFCINDTINDHITLFLQEQIFRFCLSQMSRTLDTTPLCGMNYHISINYSHRKDSDIAWQSIPCYSSSSNSVYLFLQQKILKEAITKSYLQNTLDRHVENRKVGHAHIPRMNSHRLLP